MVDLRDLYRQAPRRLQFYLLASLLRLAYGILYSAFADIPADYPAIPTIVVVLATIMGPLWLYWLLRGFYMVWFITRLSAVLATIRITTNLLLLYTWEEGFPFSLAISLAWHLWFLYVAQHPDSSRLRNPKR
jgi:hypothetical protein